MKGGNSMGTFERTSNVSVVVIQEHISRSEVNNVEAHNRRYLLKNNARPELQKYNYSFDVGMDGKRYRKIIWDNLKTGIKYDKSTLKEGEFYAPRVYKKKGGKKTTTFLETMTFCPPFKIRKDQIEDFINSQEYKYFEDALEFVKGDVYSDSIVLGAYIHLDEWYRPESITMPNGTERILEEWERDDYAYIKPHMHVDVITTKRCRDKDGLEFLKLSRGDVWKAESGRYNSSYREFNDRRFEKLDKRYGFERGEIYEDKEPEEHPIVKNLEQWQKDTDQERIQRLIKQAQKDNERQLEQVEAEARDVLLAKSDVDEAKDRIEEDIQDYIDELVESGMTRKDFDAVINKSKRDILIMALDTIGKIVEPLKYKLPRIYSDIKMVLTGTMEKLRAVDMFKDKFDRTNINR